MLEISDRWRAAYPGSAIGILAMQDVSNLKQHQGLDEAMSGLEEALRTRFGDSDRASLKALPTIQAYDDYYRRFKKTYHVLLQLESVALKGKRLPRVATLVEAMFMAELKNQLLTAGHDLNVVVEPVRIDVAQGDERYIRLNGREQVLKDGDMFIADAEGILSSILYGPDRRTRIRSHTRESLFTVYAPAGISVEQTYQHLEDIQSYVRLVSPNVRTSLLKVYESR